MLRRGGAVVELEGWRDADSRECERLRLQLYTMVDEWEELIARQKELERQFVDDDLRVQRGPRRGARLGGRGRRRRLLELISICQRLQYLEGALAWVDQRRAKLLTKLYEAASPSPFSTRCHP